ncbi:MAG: cupin domain-containing protein [Opitutaceae bacterium]|nr:cupin domain-containing protein [Opitutaceae bacterium]
MHRVHLSSLPWAEQRSPTGRFHSFAQNISLALGGVRNTGTWGGGHPFDVQIRRIPPGASVCPYHLHFAQWELFLVRAGTGTVRTPEGRTPVTAGDVFFHPPGAPHQLTNAGPGDLEVLILTDNPPLDAFYYPDSDKWGLRPPGKLFRITETDYFDGEDELPPGGASGFTIAPPPQAPAIAPFAARKLQPDALPWEPWASPKKKFRGASKELSLALGAQRHTPTGLGGHPFDLELSRLEPGECGCPFHSHAAQWELFFITTGRGTVRTGDATHEVTVGDVVLHPPGEPHQITAAPDTALEFLLIADNPPVDYWHYPDSGKWGLRAPRKFFRIAEADYWDGEE